MDIKNNNRCPLAKSCGGCLYTGTPYKTQLEKKQKYINALLGEFGAVQPIIGMEDPFYYRNKVHHAFALIRGGKIISGPYEKGSHWVLPSDNCLIEDKRSQEILHGIRDLLRSFHIKPYDEDTGYGVLRHVLIRRGFKSGEVMVVLVIGSRSMPCSSDFVKALSVQFSDIKTVVLNYNSKKTSMILGEKEKVLYGPGYICDELCGRKFRISSKSFYQVNPVQTEILYKTAIEFAALSGKETVIDSYCGIGTIGIAAAGLAKKVIGVELNPAAVKDAKINAKENGINNALFYCGDAGNFMKGMAEKRDRADIIFMDPPRSGSTTQFMDCVVQMNPVRLVYISCGPESLARDLRYLTGNGFMVEKIQPVDMFPFTEHVETVVLLLNQNAKAKYHVNVGINAEEYYQMKESR